ERRGFGDIELLRHSMERPVRSPAASAIGRAAVEAARDVYDASPVLSPMMIGTGPMHHIADTLGIATVSPAGVARPDSNIHAPNEKTGVGDFLRTVEYTGAWMKRFAEI
ncbi:MAG TPA: peptidase M20, partial [Actinomycetota bacterium]|nr:peptidase M20 [Actinomycetota bacterium]